MSGSGELNARLGFKNGNPSVNLHGELTKQVGKNGSLSGGAGVGTGGFSANVRGEYTVPVGKKSSLTPGVGYGTGGFSLGVRGETQLESKEKSWTNSNGDRIRERNTLTGSVSIGTGGVIGLGFQKRREVQMEITRDQEGNPYRSPKVVKLGSNIFGLQADNSGISGSKGNDRTIFTEGLNSGGASFGLRRNFGTNGDNEKNEENKKKRDDGRKIVKYGKNIHGFSN